jgi:hypothetical protein
MGRGFGAPGGGRRGRWSAEEGRLRMRGTSSFYRDFTGPGI